MERKIGIGLVIVMLLAACLVGCAAGKLEEEDFLIYDKEGKEIKFCPEDIEMMYTRTYDAEEGESTSRGIHLGSTVEELKEAYKDVLGSAKIRERDGGNTSYYWSQDKRSLMIFVDENGVVDFITVSKAP